MDCVYWPNGSRTLAVYSEDRQFWKVAEESNLRVAGDYYKDGFNFARQFVGERKVVQKLVKGVNEESEVKDKVPRVNKKCIKCGRDFPCNSNRQVACSECGPILKQERQRRRQQRYRDKNRG